MQRIAAALARGCGGVRLLAPSCSCRQLRLRQIGAVASPQPAFGDDGGNGGGETSRRWAMAAAATAAATAGSILLGGDSGGDGGARCASASVLVPEPEARQQRRRRRRIVTPIGAGAGARRLVAGADVGDSESLRKSALTRSGAELPAEAAKAASSLSSAAPSAAHAAPAAAPAAAAVAGTAAESASEEPRVRDDVTMSKASGMPAKVPYLIVGGGFAGMAAARAIRASDPLSRVLIVGDEPLPPYLRPPLSKELWRRKDERVRAMLSPDGDMKNNSWLFVEPNSFFIEPSRLHLADTGGVSLWRNRRVVRLDVEAKSVTLDSGDVVEFDKCLLATGGRPKQLPVLQAAGAEVQRRTVLFRSAADFQLLHDRMRDAKSVVVIGGGFLGCELAVSLAEAAKRTGASVQQVFKEEGALAHVLPPYLSRQTAAFVAGRGVEQHAREQVVSADWSEETGRVLLGLSSGRRLDADCVVVAVGIEPNTQLAEASGLELDPVGGGFLVNAEMEARSGVYAAGDACSYFDTLLGRRRVEHVNHAEESGQVAGRNMAGDSCAYQHQSSFWSNLGNSLAWDAVGLVDSRLHTHAFFAQPPAGEAAEGRGFEYPGVVFYTKAGRVVGILLWNLPDEIYQDKKQFAPSRLNLARKILAERRLADADTLAELAREFDVYQSVDDDYQDLKQFMEAKEKEQAVAAAADSQPQE